jgi:hypothetical protein
VRRARRAVLAAVTSAGVLLSGGVQAAAESAAPYDALTVEAAGRTLAYAPGADGGIDVRREADAAFGLRGWTNDPSGRVENFSDVVMRPPSSEPRLEAGSTYQVGAAAGESTAMLRLQFAGSGCHVQSGSLTVHEVSYGADPVPESLAAAYQVECFHNGRNRQLSTAGDIRWRSSTPYRAATATDVDAGVVVLDQRVARTVAYRNAGVLPVTVHDVTLSGPGAPDWSVGTNTCLTAVAPGGSCEVEVVVTPSAPGNRSAALEFHDDTRPGVQTAELAVTVESVSAPVNFQAQSYVGRTRLSWTPGPGRLPSRYILYRGSTRERMTVYKELPAGTTSVVDEDATVSFSRFFYHIQAHPDGYTWPLAGATLGPVVPPGADLILAAADATDARSVLRVASLEAHTTIVDDGNGAVTSPPSVDSTGRQTVYTRGTGAAAHVWIKDGGSPPECESCSSGARGLDPVWSPSGEELALVSPSGTLLRHGTRQYVVPSRVPVTRAAHPSWLPDGSGVVVADTAPGGLLRRVLASGAAATIPGTSDARRPAVSPRGDRIAFLTRSGAHQQLRVVPLAGAAKATTLLAGDLRHVSWAPDGSAIVLTRGATGGSEVVTIDPVTAATTSLFRSEQRIDSAVMRMRDKLPPVVTVATPPLTTGTPTIGFTITDDTRPVGALEVTCSLDGATPTPCGPTSWSGRVTTGTHTLTVTADDLHFFHWSWGPTSRSVTWTADASPPTARLLAPAATVVLAPSAKLAWSGADAGSGVASYDVRYRTASDRSTQWSSYVQPAAWQRTTSTSGALRLSAGVEYCISARSRDRAGNTSAWTPERCLARALDDRALKPSTGSWKRSTPSTAYAATRTDTRTNAAALVRTSTHARKVTLVATTCSTCGKVEVWMGARRLGAVSTYSRQTRHQVLLALPTQTAVRSGDLRLKSVQAGRRVYIDGVVLQRR